MLAYFPEPYPDETFYSLINRYNIHTMAKSVFASNKELFGRERVPASLDLPSYLIDFCGRTQHLLRKTEKQIINELTIFPFYEKFLTESRRQRVCLKIQKGTTPGLQLNNASGINASGIRDKRNLKICPLCMQVDTDKFGEPYYHRIHQIPDILICQIHNCFLTTHSRNLQEPNRYEYLALPSSIGKAVLNQNKRLVEIANLLVGTMENRTGLEWLKIDYKSVCVNRDYMTSNGKLLKELSRDFEKYYGAQALEAYGLGVSNLEWTKSIIRRPHHYFHPLKHVLLCNFLLSYFKSSNKPLNQHSFKCINPVCSSFRQPVSGGHTSHIDSKSKREIFTVQCGCGMRYTQSSKADIRGKKIIFQRVRERGELWMTAMKRLLLSGKSFREVARTLASDAKTIALLSKRGDGGKNVAPERRHDSAVFRKKWANEVNLFDFNKVKLARKANPALYAWLYRNDRSWLLAFNAKNSVRFNQGRIDWQKLDLEIVARVESLQRELIETNYSARITKSTLARCLRDSRELLGKNLSKLPKTMHFLEEVLETQDAYQSRKVRTVVNLFIKNCQQVVEWKVLRAVNLRKVNPKAKQYLFATLTERRLI